MVKKLLRFFGFSLFFLLALAAFMPKESFYFLLEKELQKFEAVISNEQAKERLLSLDLTNLEISFKEIDVAKVKTANITLLAFYNSLRVSGMELSSLADAYVPPHIEDLELRYTLLNPLQVTADIVGDFGEAAVAFSLLDRELKAVVNPSKLMQTKYKKSMRMLKKDENGEYIYAKTF